MSRRRRWTPVRGRENRIYDPVERLLLGALDLPGRAVAAVCSPFRSPKGRKEIREVLVLRLDRIGDVLMSLPALADLRQHLPNARIRLAVGSWSEEVARKAPVDDVLLWSAPWAGRRDEGAESFRRLLSRALSLRRDPPDLGIDLQGDIRAMTLLFATGARIRCGYANTGGGYLLDTIVDLDETCSWVEQNRRAVAASLGVGPSALPAAPLGVDEEAKVRLLQTLGLSGRRPLVGIHPSGGRLVKQWSPTNWGAVGSRLQREFGATLCLTGSSSDKPLAAQVAAVLPVPAVDLTGALGLEGALTLIASLDLFLSPDTGTMHMATSVGTPSVSVFGPSDPARYFSGQPPRNAVVRKDLWCSPCNLIRRPPDECAGPEPPECLRLVGTDEVYEEAARVLSRVGGFRRVV